MGFHCVAVGFDVTDNFGSLEVLLNLIAVPGTHTFHQHCVDNESLRFQLRPDLQPNFHPQIGSDFSFDDGSDRFITINLDEIWNLTFQHHKYSWIKIGGPHCCAYMMYIARIGDDLGGVDEAFTISDEDLATLIRIKNKFITAGRLPTGSKLTFKPNCCS